MRFALEHRDIATKNARLSVTLSRLSMDDRVILSPCAMMQYRRRITLRDISKSSRKCRSLRADAPKKKFPENPESNGRSSRLYFEWKYTMRERKRERIRAVVLATRKYAPISLTFDDNLRVYAMSILSGLRTLDFMYTYVQGHNEDRRATKKTGPS
jgi:hypothetical protein